MDVEYINWILWKKKIFSIEVTYIRHNFWSVFFIQKKGRAWVKGVDGEDNYLSQHNK